MPVGRISQTELGIRDRILRAVDQTAKDAVSLDLTTEQIARRMIAEGEAALDGLKRMEQNAAQQELDDTPETLYGR